MDTLCVLRTSVIGVWISGAGLACLGSVAAATTVPASDSIAEPRPSKRPCPTLVRFVANSACPLVDIVLRPLSREARIPGEGETGLAAGDKE
jgi:hypothetical protein